MYTKMLLTSKDIIAIMLMLTIIFFMLEETEKMKKTARILMCLALVVTCLMTMFCVGAKTYEFNTNGNAEGVTYGGNVTDVTVKDGVLSFKTNGTDPQLYINNKFDVNSQTGGVVNADKVKQIEIRFASTSVKDTFEVFFSSVNPQDGSYYCNPYKQGDTSEQAYAKNANYVDYTGTGNINDFITITLDQSKIKYWKGMVGHLRIDTGRTSGVEYKIDYIKFVGEDEEIILAEKSEAIKAEEKLYGECLFYDDFESYKVGDVPANVYYSLLGVTTMGKTDQCKEIKVANGISDNKTNVLELVGSSTGASQYPFIRVNYPLADNGVYTMIADLYTDSQTLKNWCFFNYYDTADAAQQRIMAFTAGVKSAWTEYKVTQDTAKIAGMTTMKQFGFGANNVPLDEKLYLDNIRVFFKKMYKAVVEGGEGVTGTAPSISFSKYGTITFPASTFSKKDYVFKGWVTNLSNTIYKAGSTLELGDITYLKVTAVWERAEPIEKPANIVAEEKIYGECLFFDDFESYDVGEIPSNVYYSNMGEIKMGKADQCGKLQIIDGFADNNTKVAELTGSGTGAARYPFLRVWYTLREKGKYTMLADYYTEAGEVRQFCMTNGYTSTANQADKRVWYSPAAATGEWVSHQTSYITSNIDGFVSMDYFGFGANGVAKDEILYIDNIRLYFSEQRDTTFVAGEGATGTAPEFKYYANNTVKLPYCPFEKEGYEFAGWLTNIDQKLHQPAEDITIGNVENFTLTAKWAKFVPRTVRKNSIRDTEDGVQGIRFAGYVADDKKEYASEIGFIATREELLGDKELAFGNTKANGVATTPDGVKVVYGATYDKATGKDLIYTKDGNIFQTQLWKNVEGTFFTGVITNIPESAYEDRFVVRPYALIDGEYVYGEVIRKSVRDIAENAYNKGNRDDFVMNVVEKTGITPGKTVCFLGDSITHDGKYIRELAQHFLNSETENGRYEFYNCGISGDTAAKAILRLEDDVLSYDPDIVFIMFGMNDIGQSLYIKANYNEDAEIKRQTNLANYKNNMITIVETLMARDVEVILCTPTPYDDVTNQVYECNVGLEKCAEIVRELAKNYGLELVDHYKNMYDLRSTKYWGVTDPIHPNALGHHVMAQSIMYDLGFIDEMELNTSMSKFSPINEERHTKSYNFRMFVMVERDLLRAGYKTTEEKLARAKTLQSQQTSDHWRWIYQNYIDNCGRGMEMLEEVIRLTEEMAVKN